MDLNEIDLHYIKGVIAGDCSAQEDFYGELDRIIRDFIFSKYGMSLDYDDDVSEIIIKIYSALSKFDPNKSSFKTWIFNIARNFMVDKSRKNNILCGSIPIDGINNSYSINAPSLDFDINNSNHVIEFELNDTIGHLKKRISCDDYALLDMHYNQGYSYNEVGCEFNLTSSTVSNRVNYVKSKLKKEFNAELLS